MTIRHILGDCRDRLRQLADQSVHCVISSPPYFGQRDYGVAGQIGLETRPETYVDRLTEVFHQVRRVLRMDGTLWLVIGDSSARKQRLLIPTRVALALQADGWHLRADIIWHKTNAMPEPVLDRPAYTHEHVLLFSRSSRYFYDVDAVKRAHCHLRDVWPIPAATYRGAHFATFPPRLVERCLAAGTSQKGVCRECGAPWGRIIEKGAIVASGPNKLAHKPRSRDRHADDGALDTRPRDGFGDLPRRQRHTRGWAPSCLCDRDRPEPATVLDPFSGAGTVGLVAARMNRNAILIELVEGYVEQARRRIARGKPGEGHDCDEARR